MKTISGSKLLAWLISFLAIAVANPSVSQEKKRDIGEEPSSADAGPLFWSVEERRKRFKNIDAMPNVRLIEAGDQPKAFGKSGIDISDVEYSMDGVSYTVDQYVDHDESIILIIVQSWNTLF